MGGEHGRGCGDWGRLHAALPALVPSRSCQVALSPSTPACLQSGGLVTLVAKGGGRVEGVRCRVAPAKRQSLAVLLSRQFKKAAGGASHPGDHGLFIGHTRFATSSTPLPSESHPHQWSPTTDCHMWRANGRGGAAAATEKCGVFITHNGDYDFSRDAAGRYRTHHELSEFLAAVLGRPPNAACDSINMAGE